MNGADLDFASVGELGRLLRARDVSAVELAERSLERLGSIGTGLNAVVTLTPELAMQQANAADRELASGTDRGPLHGIPYGAKDLLATAGIPTTWGAAPLRDQRFPEDAAVVERLRDAGAVLVAKLASVELAGGFGYKDPNAALTGPGLNPWHTGAWAGGSSSGSGAAVASGCVPFAIGSETFGSIVLPAAFCGVSGLRPTFGLVSRRGAMALSWTMDKIGPLARNAADCHAVLTAIEGFDSADSSSLTRPAAGQNPRERPRIGILKGSPDGGEREVRNNTLAALEVLKEIGTVVEVELPDYPFGAIGEVVILAEAASAFEEFIASGKARELTSVDDHFGLAGGLTMTAVDYLRAMRIRQKAVREVAEVLASYDAVVAPTVPFTATPIDEGFRAELDDFNLPGVTAVGNICGLPSVSIPTGFGDRGLPTAMEIMGRPFEEAQIVAIASAYQSQTSWQSQRPPVS